LPIRIRVRPVAHPIEQASGRSRGARRRRRSQGRQSEFRASHSTWWAAKGLQAVRSLCLLRLRRPVAAPSMVDLRYDALGKGRRRRTCRSRFSMSKSDGNPARQRSCKTRSADSAGHAHRRRPVRRSSHSVGQTLPPAPNPGGTSACSRSLVTHPLSVPLSVAGRLGVPTWPAAP